MRHDCAVVFFIGVGKVKIVTAPAILGNTVNILFDYVLIFGWGPILLSGRWSSFCDRAFAFDPNFFPVEDDP